MKLQVGAILGLAFTLMASPAFAQGGITGGLKVGVNFADISADDEDEEEEGGEGKLRIGFVAGGFVDFAVTPAVSVQPEILFTQKGTKFEGDGFEIRNELTQVQIPVLAKFKVPTSGSVKPFIVVGPGFGINTSAKAVFEVDGEEVDEDDLLDDDEVERFEVSFIFGAGVQFGKASVEVRYDLGLTNLSTEEDDAKSRTWQFLAGYSWP
jgi:opacity protein-like surface antigen